jgi:hypothetical protein
MTKTLIRKVERIKNYRIFQNWKPDGSVEFARVNLIYGQNGSGKSTFASLLAGCAANAATESEPQSDSNDATNSGLQLLAAHDAGKSFFQVGVDNRDFWGRVRVFNKDFVHRNLRFEEADGPQPEALLTIGERLADAEKRLATLQQTLASEREKLNNRETDIRLKDRALEGRKTEVAKLVVESLNGTRVATYAPRSYTKKNIARRLAEFDGNPEALNHASVDLAADIAAATEKAMPSVQLESRNSLLERDILDTVHSLLTASIFDSTPINEIAGNAARSEWVQQGLALHADLKECLFCGQELTQERRDALSAHFDESLKRLQSNIDDLVKQLKSSAQSSETYLNNIPTDTAVYSKLRADLQEARQNYKYEHAAYDAEINSIVNLLLEKRNNPFGTILLAPDLTLRAPSIDALTSVINKHQAKIDRHDVEAAEAAKRVEHFHARNFFDEYERLKAELETQKAARDHHKTTIENLEQEITTLESVDGDPVPGAEELTRGLSGLLGRDELRFSAHGSKHYVIERAGAPATHLSEGEQTAIALLYFLSSVRENKIAGDPPIVVIDDPVSSLDHGILFGASAHIWSELVVNTYASQVFLLTHNFEFFRQWLIQMEAVPKKRREGGYKAYRVCAQVDHHGCRKPAFEVWELDDDRRKKLRSQYHFLFDQVATTLKESDRDLDSVAQMEAAALVPNTARKLLEGFLSFRTPANMGKLHDSVRAALDARPGLDDSVRTMVVRYAHANSHLEEADPTKPLEPSESMPFLHALFTFMDHVDSEHFTSMCQALGHDPEVLLGTSSSTAEEAPA